MDNTYRANFRIFQDKNLFSMLVKTYFCLQIGDGTGNFQNFPIAEPVVFYSLTGLELQYRSRFKFGIRHTFLDYLLPAYWNRR